MFSVLLSHYQDGLYHVASPSALMTTGEIFLRLWIITVEVSPKPSSLMEAWWRRSLLAIQPHTQISLEKLRLLPSPHVPDFTGMRTPLYLDLPS